MKKAISLSCASSFAILVRFRNASIWAPCSKSSQSLTGPVNSLDGIPGNSFWIQLNMASGILLEIVLSFTFCLLLVCKLYSSLLTIPGDTPHQCQIAIWGSTWYAKMVRCASIWNGGNIKGIEHTCTNVYWSNQRCKIYVSSALRHTIRWLVTTHRPWLEMGPQRGHCGNSSYFISEGTGLSGNDSRALADVGKDLNQPCDRAVLCLILDQSLLFPIPPDIGPP